MLTQDVASVNLLLSALVACLTTILALSSMFPAAGRFVAAILELLFVKMRVTEVTYACTSNQVGFNLLYAWPSASAVQAGRLQQGTACREL